MIMLMRTVMKMKMRMLRMMMRRVEERRSRSLILKLLLCSVWTWFKKSWYVLPLPTNLRYDKDQDSIQVMKAKRKSEREKGGKQKADRWPRGSRIPMTEGEDEHIEHDHEGEVERGAVNQEDPAIRGLRALIVKRNAHVVPASMRAREH